MPLTGKSIRPSFGASTVLISPSDARLPAEAGEDVEQLVHLLLALARRAGPHGVRHARGDVPPEQELLHLLHGALHGGELEHDVDAVLLLLHHALDALHL